jgi:hypothetical protein
MVKILRASARELSFQEAADALEEMAEVTISSRQLTRIAEKTGHELEADRDGRTADFLARRAEPTVPTRPALAVVQVDGGRLRIRDEGDGPGAHDADWREDKVALLASAARTTFEADPEPDLPACFRDPAYVEKLAREIGGEGSLGDLAADPEYTGDPAVAAPDETPPEHAPELLVRTYVASTCDSEAFGPMVAAEAHRRNFMAAARGAFVGDGAAWIWKLQQRHFPEFEAIVDFLHVLGYLYGAAKAVAGTPARRWAQFEAWAELCWRGQVAEVLRQCRAFQEGLGPLSPEELESLEKDDPRKILAKSVGYLENNRGRMDYPRYRREGLPMTSSHAESTVKRFNRRVKGTEKSWGKTGAEAILQLRAAFLSEDGRLERHQKERICSPYRTYDNSERRKAA